jgi:hypothetical protein
MTQETRSHLINTRSGDSQENQTGILLGKFIKRGAERPTFCLATLLFLGESPLRGLALRHA